MLKCYFYRAVGARDLLRLKTSECRRSSYMDVVQLQSATSLVRVMSASFRSCSDVSRLLVAALLVHSDTLESGAADESVLAQVGVTSTI